MSTQKFDPKELKNSKRIYKSATPKYTVDWYIKWVASIFVLGGISMRGIPQFAMYDIVFSFIGVSLWLIVSFLWKDRALIVLNAAGVVLLFRTLLVEYIL